MSRLLVEAALETAELADEGKGTYLRIHLNSGLTVIGDPCELNEATEPDHDIWEIHSLGIPRAATLLNMTNIVAIEIVVKS